MGAREVPLDYALALVRRYGEKGDRRYAPAALRCLKLCSVGERLSLTDVASVAGLFAADKPL